MDVFDYSLSILIPLNLVISPSEKKLPPKLNMDIIKALQTQVAPTIFTPRAVYDGRKNMFAVRQLPFENGYQEVCVSFRDRTHAQRLIKRHSLMLAWWIQQEPLVVVHQKFIKSG